MARRKKVPVPIKKTDWAPSVPDWAKKLPKNMACVYNRLSIPFSITFDAQEEPWEGHEFRMVTSDLAKHAERRGMYRWDPLGNKTVMVLVDSRHKFFGVPLPKQDEKKPTEILVRNQGLDAPASEVTQVEVPE